MEVGTPVIFGICIIILVFLPLMTLEGMEGKMFAPLAYTIAIALGISLILSLTLSPVLSSYLLKGGTRARYAFPAPAKAALTMVLELGACACRRSSIRVALLCSSASLSLFPTSRHVLHPGDEGRHDLAEHGPCSQHLAG